MRTKKILLLICLLLVAFWAGAQDRSYSDCVVKTDSRWGADHNECRTYTADMKRDNSGTFQVELKNTCGDIVEVKVAVQEKNGIWRTFPVKALGQHETMNAYACQGTGKYMYWVRRVNDTEILLPTDREILTQYGKR